MKDNGENEEQFPIAKYKECSIYRSPNKTNSDMAILLERPAQIFDLAHFSAFFLGENEIPRQMQDLR